MMNKSLTKIPANAVFVEDPASVRAAVDESEKRSRLASNNCVGEKEDSFVVTYRHSFDAEDKQMNVGEHLVSKDKT